MKLVWLFDLHFLVCSLIHVALEHGPHGVQQMVSSVGHFIFVKVIQFCIREIFYLRNLLRSVDWNQDFLFRYHDKALAVHWLVRDINTHAYGIRVREFNMSIQTAIDLLLIRLDFSFLQLLRKIQACKCWADLSWN